MVNGLVWERSSSSSSSSSSADDDEDGSSESPTRSSFEEMAVWPLAERSLETYPAYRQEMSHAPTKKQPQSYERPRGHTATSRSRPRLQRSASSKERGVKARNYSHPCYQQRGRAGDYARQGDHVQSAQSSPQNHPTHSAHHAQSHKHTRPANRTRPSNPTHVAHHPSHHHHPPPAHSSHNQGTHASPARTPRQQDRWVTRNMNPEASGYAEEEAERVRQEELIRDLDEWFDGVGW